MTPSHTVQRVPLTEADRQRVDQIVRRIQRPRWGRTLSSAGITVLVTAVLGLWVQIDFATVLSQLVPFGGVIGLALLIGKIAYGSLSVMRAFSQERSQNRLRRQHRDAARDIQQLECISVRGGIWARLVEGSASERSLVYACRVGNGKMLLLSGPWLQVPANFGAPQEELVKARSQPPTSPAANRLPLPWSFPCADFELTQLAEYACVISVHPHACEADDKPLPVIRLNQSIRVWDCALFERGLDTLEFAIANAAHAPQSWCAETDGTDAERTPIDNRSTSA